MANEYQGGLSGQEPTSAPTSAQTMHAQGTAQGPQVGTAVSSDPSGTGGAATPPQSQQQHAQSSADDQLTSEQLRAALAKAREDAARYRQKAKEHDERLKQEELAKLSESERQARELSEARAQIEQLRQRQVELVVEGATTAIASRLGIKPELATLIVNARQSELTFSEHGLPTNIEALLTAAISELGLEGLTQQQQQAPTSSTPPGQPGLVARVAPQAPQLGATNPPRGSGNMIQGPNGLFGRDEYRISLSDKRLWKS